MSDHSEKSASVKRFRFVVSKHEYGAGGEGEKGGEGTGESGGEGSEGGGNA